MKFIGLFILLLCALAVSREYSGYSRKRIAELGDFLELARYMRTQIHCFLRSPHEIADGFDGEAIRPFISAFTVLCETSELLR